MTSSSSIPSLIHFQHYDRCGDPSCKPGFYNPLNEQRFCRDCGRWYHLVCLRRQRLDISKDKAKTAIFPSFDKDFDDLRITPIARGGPHGFRGNGRSVKSIDSFCEMKDGLVSNIVEDWKVSGVVEVVWPRWLEKSYYACPGCLHAWI